jgi:hypothetical protein
MKKAIIQPAKDNEPASDAKGEKPLAWGASPWPDTSRYDIKRNSPARMAPNTASQMPRNLCIRHISSAALSNSIKAATIRPRQNKKRRKANGKNANSKSVVILQSATPSLRMTDNTF